MLLTFVIREGLQERWRQSAETIDTATYMYSIRQDLKKIANQIDTVQETVDKHPLVTGTLTNPIYTDGYKMAFARHHLFKGALEHFDDELYHIDVLARVLPYNDPNREQIRQLETTLNNGLDKLYDIDGTLGKPIELSLENKETQITFEKKVTKEVEHSSW